MRKDIAKLQQIMEQQIASGVVEPKPEIVDPEKERARLLGMNYKPLEEKKEEK